MMDVMNDLDNEFDGVPIGSKEWKEATAATSIKARKSGMKIFTKSNPSMILHIVPAGNYHDIDYFHTILENVEINHTLDSVKPYGTYKLMTVAMIKKVYQIKI